MCQVLGIEVRRYQLWKRNEVSQRKSKTALLKAEIASIFFGSKKHYGSNKISKELHNRGYETSASLVGYYMKKMGLRIIVKRKFKVTTDSQHNQYIAPNVLNREFKTNKPSKAWLSDITYIQTKNGFLYLTIIMDLYDRKIIGWHISSRLSTNSTSLPAWEMAVRNREVLEGLIFHSDRGVQYANSLFTNKLKDFDCIQSMSRKKGPVDNAVAESFFNSIKRELIYTKNTLLTKDEMKAEIFEFIENWYNKKRIHSALNYKTIEEFNANI